MSILVVAAHPDDEVLGAGGMMARHVAQGDPVTVLILGTGLSSRLDSPEQLEDTALNALKLDARKAMQVLGVTDVRLHDFPDNRFDTVPLLDIVKVIEQVVEDVQPETIYTHFPGDLNIDHQQTAQAVLTACRPQPGTLVKRILAMEVPSATGWNDPALAFSPTVFCDISGTIDQKVEAMAAYGAEVRDWPHARSLEGVRSRSRTWGCQVGFEAAEPFVLLRELCC